eukprot:Pgem_evm1s4219
MLEAELDFPGCSTPMECIQKYITKMSRDKQYLGISEMAAGAHRDNYILVIVREGKTGIEVAGLVSPPNATEVYYCLFHDSGHFDLLEASMNLMSVGDSSIFCHAPESLK